MIATLTAPDAAERAELAALEAVIRRQNGASPDVETVSVGYYLECLAASAGPYTAGEALAGLDRLTAAAARYRAALSA